MNIILFDALTDDNSLPWDDYRALHIKKVLRLGAGDRFLAGVINGPRGEATITSITDGELAFSFAPETGEADALYPLTLLVAQVRPISMRRILREAVSLGVGVIILVSCDTSERSYAQAKLYESGEYHSILIDGAMQSGHTGLPPVLFAPSVEEAIARIGEGGERIVLDNKQVGAALSQMDVEIKAGVVLAIGGERGFSDRERGIFMAHGFRFATLGGRILRTETAVSAGCAVLLGRMGLL